MGVPEKTFSLSSGRSREDQKIKAWRNYFLVIAIFRYIPSLRDEWEGSILWVSPEKNLLSRGRSREDRKIKAYGRKFSAPFTK